jgi:hypothetical protein
MTGKITVNLAPTKYDQDGESLGELLEKAVNITAPSSEEHSSGRDTKVEARWIARWAIRAACELIIREGKIKLPLRVAFAETPGIPNWRPDYGGDYSLN